MTTLLTRNDTSVDKAWVQAAHRNRIAIKLYEFNKISNATAVRALKGPTNLSTLDHRFDQGDLAKSAILRASRHLNTEFPGSEGNLKRDYLMLKDADQLYFVGEFSLGRERLEIAGNEGWLVEMFYDLMLLKNHDRLRFPMYMYNTQMKSWAQLTMGEKSSDDRTKVPKWYRISRPPRPTGNFVGIGGSNCNQEIVTEIMMVLT